MPWTQVYDPLRFWVLSTGVAALPIVVLFYLLAVRKTSPFRAAASGAFTAILIASLIFGMPWHLSVGSFVFGAAFGLVNIVWIVFSAIFLYNISVEAGCFQVMKESVGAITADRRIQALLIAFSFGAFIEGAAGFGAPVAIAAAFMVGLGFKPFYAAALCLIANTAPVAWGAIGTPIITLSAVTGLPMADLSAMNGRILPFTSVLIPLWLVRTMVPWKETLEVLPAIAVCGLSFAITQFLWSNFIDTYIVDIVGGLVSLLVMVLFLRFWQPPALWRFEEERHLDPARSRQYSPGEIFRAWMPFLILSLFVLAWGWPSVKTMLNAAHFGPLKATYKIVLPFLHNLVARDVPVVPVKTVEPAVLTLNWLGLTGTGCFTAALVSGTLLGLSPPRLFRLFIHTLKRMRYALATIICMLGLGFVTRYSGIDAVLGLAFTRTGVLYPFFGTLLGWLGVALTGSDTASNALFGSLQRITAEQLNLDPILMASANSAGGVMGKMIDAQSIVVATVATHQVGNEGIIFRFVLWHSIALAAIVGMIVLAIAYLFPGWVPHGVAFKTFLF